MKKKTRSRNPEKTRAKILKAATRLFTKSGYEGTSLSGIVRATGVNKRMIYHYFGDKRGLYHAVFVQEWAELKSWIDRDLQEHLRRPGDVRDLLVRFVETFFDFLSEHQHFTRLMMWEGLEGGDVSKATWKEIRGPLFLQAEFIIQQAQKEGLLDPAFQPGHLVISFLATVTYYFAYAPSLGDMIRKDPLAPATLRERKKQTTLLLESIFRKPRKARP